MKLFPTAVLFLTTSLPFIHAAAPSGTLWQIGLPDNSGAEFSGKSNPKDYAVPDDWSTRTSWAEWKPATLAEPWDTSISYTLNTVPAGGAEFTLKTTEAGAMVPEVAVYSNGILMGILQIAGAETPGKVNPRKFGNTYKVYIPKEFLKPGSNSLRLRKLPGTYARNSENYNFLEIYFDYMSLTGLAETPAEPVHSRTVWIGSVNGSSSVDQVTMDSDPLTWEWFGVAHSGNPVRATFWSTRDGSPTVTKRTEWLQKAMEFHMSPVLNYLTDQYSAANPTKWMDAEGVLLASKKEAIDRAFSDWGKYVQYYQLSNEPCQRFTNASLAVDHALADYISQAKPSHVKLVSPGYTYGGKHGDPVNWDVDDANRIALDAKCDLAGGHAYGRRYSYVDGSNLMETIDTQGTGDPKTVTNGLSKDILVTECGTVDFHHADYPDLGIPPEDLYSSCYDKILRAHIGFAHRFLNFSTFGESTTTTDTDHTCILGSRTVLPADWKAQVFPKTPESETKLSIFRRLVCAYSTHGKPLPYTYLNEDEVKGQLVYFRPVDTSTLPPMAGNGHTSDKVLLNLVNFDTTAPRRMQVEVTLPVSGTYTGTRFDGSAKYTEAKSEVTLKANPTATLDVTLKPGEAVQYILNKP